MGMIRLAYMMFADDTTVIGKSRRSLEAMLEVLIEMLGYIGLHLNAAKCVVRCSIGSETP